MQHINGKSNTQNDYEIQYMHRPSIRNFIDENKILDTKFVSEYRMHIINSINEGFIKYDVYSNKKVFFILSYSQLISLYSEKQIDDFFENLYDSNIQRNSNYNFSVIQIQIRYDRHISTQSKANSFYKFRMQNIRDKYNCFYKCLKLLVNDRSIKISKICDKFQKKTLNEQMTIFHNYQTKYRLKDFELYGILCNIIWNIEEICLLVFSINDYEYHTIYWDINSEISKKMLIMTLLFKTISINIRKYLKLDFSCQVIGKYYLNSTKVLKISK